MKTTLIVSSLCLCQALCVIAAEPDQSAPPNSIEYHPHETLPFYASVSPALSWVQDVSFSDSLERSTMKFHPGGGVDFVFGHNFNESLALEFNMGFLIQKSSTERDAGGEFVHDILTQLPYMVNVRYQIPTHSRWHPFVGGGVGGVYTSLDDEEDFFGIGATVNTGSDFTFAYQAFAGVRYEISRHFELGLEYKFMGTTEHDLGDVHMDPIYSHSLAFMFYFPF